jgi:hypothetical protein
VLLLLDDVHAQCCVAGGPLFYHCNLLPSLKMTQDTMILCPPCRFRLQFIRHSFASTGFFHLQGLYLVIWTGVDPFFRKWKISGPCIRIQPILAKFSARTLEKCRGERAHSNVEKPNAKSNIAFTSILGEDVQGVDLDRWYSTCWTQVLGFLPLYFHYCCSLQSITFLASRWTI